MGQPGLRFLFVPLVIAARAPPCLVDEGTAGLYRALAEAAFLPPCQPSVVQIPHDLGSCPLLALQRYIKAGLFPLREI